MASDGRAGSIPALGTYFWGMRFIRCPFFYVVILVALPALGQDQLTHFAERQPDTTWRPEVLAYVRNTEFFHPAEEGRTRFGALAGMRRRYDLAAGRSAELGGFVHQEFGALPRFIPWVRLEYQRGEAAMAFGSIRDRSHGLPRQLVNPDLRYAVPVVYGLEGSAAKNSWGMHYWVEWLTAIDYGSPFKERIHGGVTGGFASDLVEVKGVVQYHHVGGQIDASPDSDGNRLNYGVIGRASLGAVELHATHLRYADPLERFGPEAQGFGTSADVSVAASPKLRLEANYWQARNFRAPLGQGLFQSRNPEDPTAWFREQPQLLGLGVAWEGASSLRIRAWYDVVDRSVQPSVTWVRYLVLDPVSGTRYRKGQAPQ